MKSPIAILFLVASITSFAQTTTPVSPIVQKEKSMTVDVDFEKFTNMRSSGKALQIIGTAVLTTSIILIMKQHNDSIEAQNRGRSYSPNKLPLGLAVGGGSMIMAGIVLDLNAGKYLKRKR